MAIPVQQIDVHLSSNDAAINHLKLQSNRSPFNNYKILQHVDSLKEFLDESRRYQITPITVEIHPTNKCNLRCKDCTFQDADRTKEIDSAALNRVAQELICLKTVKAIVWSGGGEPTLNSGLTNSANLFGQAGMEQGIATNGTYITDELADTIVKFFTYARISLNAASAQSYLKMHAADKFAILKTNIERLRQKRDQAKIYKLTLGSSFLVYPENCQEIPMAIKNADDLGLDYLQIKPAVLKRMVESFEFLCDAYHELSNLSFDQIKTTIMIDIDKFQDLQSLDYGRNYSTCWGALFYATIAADKNVYICCHKIGDEKYSFGSLGNESFQKIWFSDRKRDVLRSVNVSLCPPNCKLHKINKVLQDVYDSQFAEHKNFL
ncbi:MAG: radical SAM protein [Chloroflexi bacterium]|nr:radical SAM protein [Chloroflexota bacterium]